MKKVSEHESISLYKWIWNSYIRTSLIPLILFELIFICIYFSSYAWSTLSNIDWKLLMISGLILSCFIFFIILYRNSRKATYLIANSLLEINNIVQRISDGEYNLKEPLLNIKELKDIGVNLVKMGENLGEANKNLLLTQSQLRKKETDLKALVNSINDIILEVDSKGSITNLWSRAHRDLFKFYLQGNFNSIDNILDSNTCKIARRKIVYVLQTKETVTMDFTIESNTGLKWFQASISPRLNDPTKAVVSARDITDQKKNG